MNNEVDILCVDNDDIIQTVDNSSFFYHVSSVIMSTEVNEYSIY